MVWLFCRARILIWLLIPLSLIGGTATDRSKIFPLRATSVLGLAHWRMRCGVPERDALLRRGAGHEELGRSCAIPPGERRWSTQGGRDERRGHARGRDVTFFNTEMRVV
jgi:hypothetical protein